MAYPFPEPFFDKLPVSRGGRSYLEQVEKNKAPLICKLHGSINFFENLIKNHPDDKLKIADDIAAPHEDIGGSSVNYDWFSIFALGWWLKVKEETAEDIIPAFIPPTYAKLEKRDWLRYIWATAFQAIQRAKCIFFIGYSIPETDGFIKSFIQGALAQRDSKASLEIYLVKPLEKDSSGDKLKDSVFLRYNHFFHDGFSENNFIDKTFSAASQDGDIEGCLSKLI